MPKKKKPRQHPKPRYHRITIELNEVVIGELEKLLASGLFGFTIESTAERVMCRWLFENRDHPFLEDDDAD